MYVEKIGGADDLKKLSMQDLPYLAEEIRELLIAKGSECGGHLASNLGIVELTIALHYVFDSPFDKFVFDVSHQTYCHKLLTGRKEAFISREKYKTVTGFSNPDESEHDHFAIGHTSTSVSLACGLAKARDLMGGTENVIAIIGDASLDGGEAFEALNCAAELGGNLIVVINDNEMSIPENHGTLACHLGELRRSDGKSEDNFFRALGWDYHLVKNGHSIPTLVEQFSSVKNTRHPVVVHVCTQKGKGFEFAEDDREKWHWARPFDRATGEFLSSVPKENYGNIVANHLLEKIGEDPKVVVMAASTPICIGFDKKRREAAGAQYVDVGIAEQHAVTMAVGIAKGGGKPVFATNATFLQRAYDQIQQEMCINRAPVTIIVTHASVYGHHNDTHVGLLDIPLLGHIPNLTYLAPVNNEEYLAMLDWSLEQSKTPVAIRVPWTGVHHTVLDVPKDYSEVSYQIVNEGEKVCVIALGGFFELGRETAELLKERTGIAPTLINPRFITGVDNKTLDWVKNNHQVVVTIEDGVLSGGFGSKIAQYYADKEVDVYNFGFSLNIPRTYDPAELMIENSLSAAQIVEKILG